MKGRGALPTALTVFLIGAPAAFAAQVKILPLKHEARPLVRTVLPLRRDVRPLKAAPRALRAKAAEVKEAMRALKAERTDRGELKLNISADVLFAFDSAAIRPQAARALSQVALMIREKKPRRVRIEGHTDAKGSDAYNMRLSLRRAESVRRWLGSREKIDTRLMTVKGYGERRPVAPNANADGSDNPEGRRRNRRVEIFLR